jgi:solute carrier family 29 (equilibrative nucleoside transporter), member 1/2/3
LTYFSVAYSYPNLLGLIVMIFFGHLIPLQVRVMATFASFFFLLMTIPIMGFAQIENAPVIGLIITFSVLIVLAFGTSILRLKCFV